MAVCQFIRDEDAEALVLHQARYDEGNLADHDREEFDFIECPPEDFFCPVTFELLVDPHQTKCCGNHLSEKVVNRLLRDGKPCPMCKDPQFETVFDKFHRRKVIAVQVRCPHKAMGCEWVGEVGEAKRHADHCSKRPWRCQYCEFTSLIDFGEHHIKECIKYPVPCPNNCAVGSVARCDIKKHLLECPLELVTCEFSEVGCNLKIARQELGQHMMENQQQHMLLVAFLNLNLTKEAVMGKDHQIAEKEHQLAIKDRQLSEKEHQLHEKDLLFAIKLAEKDAQLAEKDREIAMKDKSIADYERRLSQLQHSLEKSRHDQIFRRDDVIAKMEKKMTKLRETVENMQDNFMKSTSHILRLTSHEFTLDDFSECQDGPNGDWFSEPFYTHPNGYKMELKVETKKIDAHMRVFLRLYRSDQLQWPVTFTVALQLLNRADKFNHYLRWFECTFERNPHIRTLSEPWKFIRFTKLLKDDETTQYIGDDDSLKFRLWIKINNC